MDKRIEDRSEMVEEIEKLSEELKTNKIFSLMYMTDIEVKNLLIELRKIKEDKNE